MKIIIASLATSVMIYGCYPVSPVVEKTQESARISCADILQKTVTQKQIQGFVSKNSWSEEKKMIISYNLVEIIQNSDPTSAFFLKAQKVLETQFSELKNMQMSIEKMGDKKELPEGARTDIDNKRLEMVDRHLGKLIQLFFEHGKWEILFPDCSMNSIV